SSSISPTANSYFGSSTVSQLQTALQNAGFLSDESIDIINAAATQLSGTSYSSNYVAEAVNLIADSVSASKSGKTIDNNQSAISVNGIALLEVPLTYGRPINDSIALGASLKLIKGRVYQRDITIFNNNSSEIVNDLRDSYKESNNFALDFGALWMPNNWIKVGATAKYLNSPSFDKPDGGEYKVKPQGRVGIALNPFETLTFALDMDVTKNDTSVNGYKSQNIGGGVEWDVLKFLALRAGAYQNLAESDIGMVYTLGLGLNMYLVRGDLSVAFSGKKNQYDGDNIPKETRIQANLSIEF
ncbi:MAG: conjugal transfer protein TraF, partial [Calditerrivibrio sp.]|nr:conjugal transfer protein TraF [Calditerrivibrio sp.]MCA1980066.1 conjugal transfer protein TraF [Calditerrivibrio sp.]